MATVRRTRLRLLYFTIAFVIVNLLLTGLDIHPMSRARLSLINLPIHCASLPCDTIIFGRPVSSSIVDPPSLSVPDGVDIYTNYTLKRLNHLSGSIVNDVTSFRYSINADAQCRSNDGTLMIVVIVVTAPDHFEKRTLVRQTWASRMTNTSWGRHVFLTGKTSNSTHQKTIEEESQSFGDIVQLDMMDSYEILTLKSVALLHWSQHHCSSKVPFILKCDDDVYINTERLQSAVVAIKRTIPYYEAGVYGTKIVIDNPPQRKLESKHYVSLELWPWPAYPSYLYGGCYLLGRKSLAPLLAAAQTTPYFPFEDLYLIGLCSRKAHVPLWTFDKMFVMENGNRTSDPCFVGESITWQTRWNGQFVESHLATKKLQENQIKCQVIKSRSSSSSSRTSPSAGAGGHSTGSNVIHFQLIDPTEYETWSRNVSLHQTQHRSTLNKE